MKELVTKIVLHYQIKYNEIGHEYVNYIDVDNTIEHCVSLIQKNYDSERGSLNGFSNAIVRNALIGLSNNRFIKERMIRDKKLELILN